MLIYNALALSRIYVDATPAPLCMVASLFDRNDSIYYIETTIYIRIHHLLASGEESKEIRFEYWHFFSVFTV